MENNGNEIIDDLITRCLTGEGSAEEQDRLAEWIRASKGNEQHYVALKKTLALADSHKGNQEIESAVNVETEWQRFASAIGETGAVRSLNTERKRYPLLRIAAAVLVLVSAGLIVNYFVSGRMSNFKTLENTLAIELPDGSEVVLNQFSELTYSNSYGSNGRMVQLKGEAFFAVQPDKSQPFIVQLEKANVEVLGTSFNVQGYDNRNEVEIIVESGVVKFSVPALQHDIRLEAGQKGVYSKSGNSLEGERNTDLNFLSWKTRKLVFDNADLRTVMDALSKTYGITIKIGDQVPATCAITVSFDKQTLEAVLLVLQSTLGLEYKTTGNSIEITAAGC